MSNVTARLGMIVPSSNTVVEAATPSLLPMDFPVAVHVSRLRVTHIAADQPSTAQFDATASLAAASLLADAKVDLILWNGTAASWLGFDRDDRLIEAIEAETGIEALTAITALNGRLNSLKARRIGLVTPYVEPLEAAIVENYRRIGIDVVASERLDLTVNTDFAAVPRGRIAAMVEAVARSRPDAILILCTNLAGADVAEEQERSLGIPVLDSVSIALSASVERLRRRFASPDV